MCNELEGEKEKDRDKVACNQPTNPLHQYLSTVWDKETRRKETHYTIINIYLQSTRSIQQQQSTNSSTNNFFHPLTHTYRLTEGFL